MPVKVALVGLVATLIAGPPTLAATPTAEQAAAVTTALERYVGQGAPGTARTVTVTPEGDHYAIAFDLQQVLRGLDAFGWRTDPATIHMTAMPLEAGTWRVTQVGGPQLTIRHGEDSYSVVSNNFMFDGIFDPQILTFQSSKSSYDSISVAVVAPEGGTQIREIKRGTQTWTGTPAGDGVANITAAHSDEGFTQDFTIDAGRAGLSRATSMSFKSASASQHLSVDRLRTRALADIWAFMVAHPDKAALRGAQADLRGVLRQALPLFDGWTQSGSVQDLSAATPIGAFTLRSAVGQVKTTGLAADGEVMGELTFDGLTLPSGLLPDWAEGLVPTSGTFKEGLTGFHLDVAARRAVESFDLGAAKPFSPDAIEQITQALGPFEGLVVTIAPSHFASRLLQVDVAGEIRLRQPIPDFHATIRAAGLDAALQDIQRRGGSDKTTAKLMAALVFAKGLGKAEPDGSLSWALESTDAGGVTVNGLALPAGTGP